MDTLPDCVFCQIVSGKSPAAKVYEDDDTLAFLRIIQFGEGHTLVIPKSHRSTLYELDDSQITALSRTTLRVSRAVRDSLSPEGLNLFQANGAVAGQTVFHVHFHILPRSSGDRLRIGVHGAATGSGDIQSIAQKIRQSL